MSKNWAICIGINEYHNLPSLKYAQRDAVAMRDFCLNEARFEKVYFFAEGAALIQPEYGSPLRAEPTFGSLERFFDVRFREPFLEAEDNLWFFFAGHGRRCGKQDYLMPMDGNPGNVVRTGLAIADISSRLRGSGAGNIILMLDACRGEDSRDGGEGIGAEAQQGVISLFSCSPNELSYEIDELKQGAFTYSLLQGLRIRGEGNCATVERLYQHLRYQVPELNLRYKKQRQTPYAIAEPATKLHYILLPSQATLQDVLALKNDALEAEAEADLELAEQLWINVLVSSPGDRQAVKALQRIERRRIEVPVEPKPPKPSKPTFSFEVVSVDTKGNISQRAQRSVEYHREGLGQGVDLDLVLIPSGTFVMGSAESEAGRDWYKEWDESLAGVNVEGPQHEVKVPAFMMGKYPITQAQWRAVASFSQVERALNPDPANFKGDERPVEQVSWEEATEFCQRLSQHTGRVYRLPSEAEWEYACRAGTRTPFHFGETLTSELVNYDANYVYGSGSKGEYREQTTNVGSFPANAFGLYDMHGNVWEWCQDHWHENYQDAPKDGSAWITSGDASRRLLRGGSWGNNPDDCRSANRSGSARDIRYDAVGFRVVCVSS